jgi:hypothetical protein
MTPEEFIAESKRRGLPKEQVQQKYSKLKASGAFSSAPEGGSFLNPIAQGANKPLSASTRAMYGLTEPIDALAQMAYNALPESVQSAGDSADQWLHEKTGGLVGVPEGNFNRHLAERERRYQSQAPEGVDAARIGGSVVLPMLATRKLPAPSTFSQGLKQNAAVGGVMGALFPVYDDSGDFWSQKAKQAGIGAGVGGALTPVTHGISRVLMPKAATNPDVSGLMKSGTRPTIGQALGGGANRAEEKLTSVPILGDAISSARSQAKVDFNVSAINRALAPIGKKITDAGHAGVEKATRLIGDAYDDALKGLKGVTLDKTASREIDSLNNLVKVLPKTQANQFKRFFKENVSKRLSPAKGMTAETFKELESELGSYASTYQKSAIASEKKLGDAFSELQSIFRKQAARSNPDYAKALENTNKAYANLVRVQGAAKKAANAEESGIFTPGQLMMAVREADKSVRKNATSRGNALMQDLAGEGQRVLGNKVGNSFTTDRALLSLGTLATGAINPAIPAGLLAGAGMYSRPVQNALVSAVTKRPEAAGLLSQIVRKSTPGLTIPAMGLLQSGQ